LAFWSNQLARFRIPNRPGTRLKLGFPACCV
jgi:hypothetical protein